MLFCLLVVLGVLVPLGAAFYCVLHESEGALLDWLVAALNALVAASNSIYLHDTYRLRKANHDQT